MTQQLDVDRVRAFIRQFQAEYSDETILPDICDVTVYQEEFSKTYGDVGNWSFIGRGGPRGHFDLDYNQIGQRSLIPVSILNSEQPLDVIRSFVRRLKLGERNYVLTRIEEKAQDNEIDTIVFDEPTHEDFQDWCGSIQNPDHLFLPLDSEFHDTVFDWRQENNYYFNIGEAALAGPNIVKIHWVPLDSGIENGYLISSEGMTVVQKWFGDSPGPRSFSINSRFNQFSENRPLMVYVGDEVVRDEEEDTKGFEEKVDFLYRVVLSDVMVDSGHAVKLQPTRELSSD